MQFRTGRNRQLVASAKAVYRDDAAAVCWAFCGHGTPGCPSLRPTVRRHAIVVAASRHSPWLTAALIGLITLTALGQMAFIGYALQVADHLRASTVAALGCVSLLLVGVFVHLFRHRPAWQRVAAGLTIVAATSVFDDVRFQAVLIGGGVVALATFELGLLAVRATQEWVIPRSLAARGRVPTLAEFTAVGLAFLLHDLCVMSHRYDRPQVQRDIARWFRVTARPVVRRSAALARARGADAARNRRRAAGIAALLAGYHRRLSDGDRAAYGEVCADLAALTVSVHNGDWTKAEETPEIRVARRWPGWPVAVRLSPYAVAAALIYFLNADDLPREVILGALVTVLTAGLASIPWNGSGQLFGDATSRPDHRPDRRADHAPAAD